MMVKVKVCGITNVRDARSAATAGADALGFNFVAGSKRYIDPQFVRPIIMEVPPFVSCVGVFVNAEPQRVVEIMDMCGLHYAQLHGSESPARCARLKGRKLIKAFRIRKQDDVRELAKYRVDAYLLDTYVPGQQGGTGETFDWSIARAAREHGRIIIAGGLTPDNVAQAIRQARPYGVDVASGVEEEPGLKSRRLVQAFIRNAKNVDV